MTDRDRLIELLKQGNRECSQKSLAEIKKILDEKHSYNSETDKPFNLWEALADYLLANGVIVPPCKVGDYVKIEGIESFLQVESIHYYRNGLPKIGVTDGRIAITFTIIEKFEVFTKEEAEEKLKELNK